MITVGFTLIGRGAWSGGESYLRNMLSLIAAKLNGEIEAKLFVSPEQFAKIGTSFDDFLAVPVIVDKLVAGAGAGSRAITAIVRGTDNALAEFVMAHGVDVMFESAQWFGNRFPVPTVSWIPDFQHRRMAHLFPRMAWWRRDIGFRVQTSGRRVIMLSSADALADCEKFYPASRGKTCVVRFAIDLDPAPLLDRASDVRAAYRLPERFFFLPNQFWAHKNHTVVVEALRRLRNAGDDLHLPPVILTGRTEDSRDPNLYARLIAEVSADGLDAHFRHLGLIPYSDVVALNAASDHLLNPSYFEGWSTTVEEAKALGTPMVLSDIPVHREQAPSATFFPPDDADALARILGTIGRSPARPRECPSALRSAQARRRDDHAAALLAVFNKAVAQLQLA